VSSPHTALVVEDEPGIAAIVRDYLARAGFDVTIARDGTSALTLVRQVRPDVVVLDLGLPGKDGLDVLRELRTAMPTPVLVLTARGDEADRIVGLELGADDYIVKPFSPRELVARVRAVLRRSDGPALPTDVIRAGDLVIDCARLRVEARGARIDLTPTETQLLAHMARQPGRVFTRAQLLDAIHGVAFESFERAIDAHVKNIRKKIEPDPREPKYLLTVYGVGYRFSDDLP